MKDFGKLTVMGLLAISLFSLGATAAREPINGIPNGPNDGWSRMNETTLAFTGVTVPGDYSDRADHRETRYSNHRSRCLFFIVRELLFRRRPGEID